MTTSDSHAWERFWHHVAEWIEHHLAHHKKHPHKHPKKLKFTTTRLGITGC